MPGQTFATLSTSWGTNVAYDSISLSLSLNNRLSFLTGKNVTNLSGQIGFIGNQAFSSLRSDINFFGLPIKGFSGGSFNANTLNLDAFTGLASIVDLGAFKLNSWGAYSTASKLQFGFNIHLDQSLNFLGIDRKFKLDFGYRPNLTGTPYGSILDDLGIVNPLAPNARHTNGFDLRTRFDF